VRVSTQRGRVGRVTCDGRPYRVDARRIFNERDGRVGGGRIYGGWQNLPKRERLARFRVDGERVVEADYAGVHVALAYAAAGLDLVGDPYRVYGDARDAAARPVCKRLLLAMINCAGGPAGAASAIRNQLRADGVDVRALEAAFGETLHEIARRLVRRHEPIRCALGRGAGLALQRVDSEIMLDVLDECRRADLPVLPIHDSVLCAESRAGEAVEIMRRCYRRVAGRDVGVTVDAGRR
jgi:hypothetical protein